MSVKTFQAPNKGLTKENEHICSRLLRERLTCAILALSAGRKPLSRGLIVTGNYKSVDTVGHYFHSTIRRDLFIKIDISAQDKAPNNRSRSERRSGKILPFCRLKENYVIYPNIYYKKLLSLHCNVILWFVLFSNYRYLHVVKLCWTYTFKRQDGHFRRSLNLNTCTITPV